jgi:hypothetical protein
VTPGAGAAARRCGLMAQHAGAESLPLKGGGVAESAADLSCATRLGGHQGVIEMAFKVV